MLNTRISLSALIVHVFAFRHHIFEFSTHIAGI